jgi:hypothetical protein
MEAGPARIEAEASETGDDGAEALPRPPRRSSQAHAVFKKPVKTKKNWLPSIPSVFRKIGRI